MPKRIEIHIGARFDRLVMLREVESRSKSDRGVMRCFAMKCDCGNEIVVRLGNLRSGHTRSCGCMKTEIFKNQSYARTHGETMPRTTEYRSWDSMRSRCHCPTHHKYKDYGARGIIVCVEWRDDYTAFLCDMGRKPSPRHSIDRYSRYGSIQLA